MSALFSELTGDDRRRGRELVAIVDLPVGTPLSPALVAHLREVSRIDEFDRVRTRLNVSSGEFYPFAYGDQGRLLNDELSRFAGFVIGQNEGRNGVVAGGHCGGDLGDAGAQFAPSFEVDHQLPGLGHVTALGDNDLQGQIDRKFDKAIRQRQLRDKGRLGSFVHAILLGLIARIKAAFGRGVE